MHYERGYSLIPNNFPAGHNLQTSNIFNTISGFGRSSNHNIHIIYSSLYKARVLLISEVYLWFWTSRLFFKKFDSWWNQNQLSLLYKIWLYHSSMLHWRLVYCTIPIWELKVFLSAWRHFVMIIAMVMTTMMMFLSHLTRRRWILQQQVISAIQHPTMQIWYIYARCGFPTLCLHRKDSSLEL